MTPDMIDAYEAGGARLRAAVAGLNREQLTARPGPGAWSIQEVVIHLADSDAISIDRMKRMLTEDDPPLLYADETAYNDRLHPHEQDLEDALTLFEVGRRQFARVLRLLPPEAFARGGTHNRRGKVTVGGMVADYVEHVEHHLGFVRRKRANLGVPFPEDHP
jgi:uncharacterized damage-inducible protein DinB